MLTIRFGMSADRPSKDLSIFPYRPVLKAASPTRVKRRSLQKMMRVIAFASQVALAFAASSVFETETSAQAVARIRSSDRFADFIAEAAHRFAIPARWLRAVMQVESGGDEHAKSNRGAMGLMQIMPSTWVEFSARYELGLDPSDPRDNILAGAAYLNELHDRFGSAGFLAAYHAGPLRYEQHLATGRPLPPETLAYVAAVTRLFVSEQTGRSAYQIGSVVPWRQAPLFVKRVDGNWTDDRFAFEEQRASQSATQHKTESSTLAPLPADLFARPSTESRPQ